MWMTIIPCWVTGDCHPPVQENTHNVSQQKRCCKQNVHDCINNIQRQQVFCVAKATYFTLKMITCFTKCPT